MTDDEARAAAARAAVKDWVAESRGEPVRAKRIHRGGAGYRLEYRMHKWWGDNPKWSAWRACGRYETRLSRQQALDKFEHEKQVTSRHWIEYRLPPEGP